MPRSCVRSRASIASNKKSSRETPGASAVQFTTANQLANSNTQQWVELQLSSWWPQSQLYRLHSQSKDLMFQPEPEPEPEPKDAQTRPMVASGDDDG